MISHYYFSKSPVSYLDTPFERGIRTYMVWKATKGIVNFNELVIKRGIITAIQTTIKIN